MLKYRFEAKQTKRDLQKKENEAFVKHFIKSLPKNSKNLH